MTAIKKTLENISSVLATLGVEWALVGGLAVSARTSPRFTADVDVAVSVDDDPGAEALVRALLGKEYRLSATVEQDAVERLATARLLTPGQQSRVVVDVLFASSGIEPEIVRDAEMIEVMRSLPIPTATVGHLLALKILSRDDDTRPQDRADAIALLSVAAPSDLAAAREALKLIAARGFERGRDLGTLLDELISTT